MSKGEVHITFTRDEAHAVAEFIDNALLDYIRKDESVDSLYWLMNVLRMYELLGGASGYEGLPEELRTKGEEGARE